MITPGVRIDFGFVNKYLLLYCKYELKDIDALILSIIFNDKKI